MSSAARKADLSELVTLSSDIVVGIVSQSETFWQGRRIFTRHTLETGEVWRGQESANRPLTFLTMGGRVGNIAQHVAGTPKVQLGERVVLFLARDGQNLLHPVGMTQGVFHVRSNVLRRDLSAFEFINPEAVPVPRQLSELKRAVLEVAP